MDGRGAAAAPWVGAAQYEAYVGRWSRLVAREFLARLDVQVGSRWLDVGCGTGALTEAVLEQRRPAGIVGIDPSAAFVARAAATVRDARASFRPGDAETLPFADATVDAVVSGLVLNFVPDPPRALAEMGRVTRPGGLVGAYVWDYAEGMQLVRVFWEAVADRSRQAAVLAEAARFPLCRPAPLSALFAGAALADVCVDAIDVPTVFASFEDYWTPFLGGTGPAPAYVAELTEDDRADLRDRLRARLPADDDGAIRLTARAWAVQGRVRGSHSW